MTQTNRLAAATIAGGVAWLVQAGNHLANPPFDYDELTETAHYVNDGSFTAALVLSAAGYLLMQGPRRRTAAAVAGQLLVAIGVAAGLVTGTVPGWFAAVGVPGNLLAFGACIGLAVWAWRTGALPRPAAAALAVIVPVGLALASVGGGLLPAALWLYLGARALSAPVAAPSAAPAR
jgi:hypothetical protein